MKTKKEEKIEEEIHDICDKKYCKGKERCTGCKRRKDCFSYDCEIFGKVAIQMIIKLRKENQELKDHILHIESKNSDDSQLF